MSHLIPIDSNSFQSIPIQSTAHLSQHGLLNPSLHPPGELGIGVVHQLRRHDGRADVLGGVDDLLDPGDSQCDVHRGDACEVECLQRHLGSRLADTLRGQRADCGTRLDPCAEVLVATDLTEFYQLRDGDAVNPRADATSRGGALSFQWERPPRLSHEPRLAGYKRPQFVDEALLARFVLGHLDDLVDGLVQAVGVQGLLVGARRLGAHVVQDAVKVDRLVFSWLEGGRQKAGGGGRRQKAEKLGRFEIETGAKMYS